MTALAPPRPFDDVRKIAVLRGGGLGDLVFALPAIDALATAYPDAEIVLLGTGGAKALLEGRPGPVARVEVLPRAAGVHGGDGDDPHAIAGFVERMRAERFDLACQLHGGGRNSNPFLVRLEARHTVGTATPDAVPLERTLAYLYYQHEIMRWLEAVWLAGAPAVGTEPVVAVPPGDLRRGRELVGGDSPLVVMHPGSTDPRRRWPAERFVELAHRLVADGMRVAVVGDGGDMELAARIADAAADTAGRGILALAGRLSLAELVAVLAVADVVVGNDSGPRHLAQAVGARTVGLFWVGNLINGGPLTRDRHRVRIGWTTHCPVCGRDVTQVGWTAPRCEHDESLLSDVSVDAVYEDVHDLTATTARLRDT